MLSATQNSSKYQTSSIDNVNQKTDQNQWLNIETFQLKNEVSELQRILDEINQTTKLSCLLSGNLLKQPADSGQTTVSILEPELLNSAQKIQENVKASFNTKTSNPFEVTPRAPIIVQSSKYSNEKPKIQKLSEQKQQTSVVQAKSQTRISNLRQPTKIQKARYLPLQQNKDSIEQESYGNQKKTAKTERSLKPNNVQDKKSPQNNKQKNKCIPQLKASQVHQNIDYLQDYIDEVDYDISNIKNKNMMKLTVKDSLDTSIRNKYNMIIHQLEDEIQQDELLTSAMKQKQQEMSNFKVINDSVLEYYNDAEEIEQKQSESFVEEVQVEIQETGKKQNLEDELEKMRQTLEMIKQQEQMLIKRISQDDIQLRVPRTGVQSHQSFGQEDDFISLNIVHKDKKNGLMKGDESSSMNNTTDNDDNQSELSNMRETSNTVQRHLRRISRQSFGCRSLADIQQYKIQNDLTDSSNIQEQTKHSTSIKSGIPQLSLNTQENSLTESQITTPRTNISNPLLQDDITKCQSNNNAQNPIQTPFFNRFIHVKKDSIGLEQIQERTVDYDLSVNNNFLELENEIEIREKNLSQISNINLIEEKEETQACQYKESQHAFHTSRNFVKGDDITYDAQDINQTPRESLLRSIYTSQKSISKQNSALKGNQSQSKSRTRNNFDYSKISKHQSIAKIFENRRISKLQNNEKNGLNPNSNFENRKSSIQGQGFSERQSLNSQASHPANLPKNQCIIYQDQSDNNQSKERTSLSKDRSFTKLQTTIQQKNLRTLGTRETKLKQQSTARVWQQQQDCSPSKQASIERTQKNLNELLIKAPSLSSLQNSSYPSVSSSTRNITSNLKTSFTANANLNHQIQNIQQSFQQQQQQQTFNQPQTLSKDHSLVRLRKLELDQEKQEKLLQKIMMKENKMNQIAQKKQENEKYRREFGQQLTIQEKTMRISKRIEDPRKIVNQTQILQGNENQKSLNTTQISMKTNNISMIGIKSQRENSEATNTKTPSRNQKIGMIYNKSALTHFQKEIESNKSVSPYKPNRFDMPLQRVINDRQSNNRYTNISQNSSSSFLNCSGSSLQNQTIQQSSQANHQRINCENCQKLLSKGLSSIYCPMQHNSKTLKQSKQNSQNYENKSQYQKQENPNIGDLINSNANLIENNSFCNQNNFLRGQDTNFQNILDIDHEQILQDERFIGDNQDLSVDNDDANISITTFGGR